MRLIFLDTETTGNGTDDRLCQLAAKERGVEVPVIDALYKPPMPITLEAMAVHHITQKMVDGRPAFKDSEEYAPVKALLEDPQTVVVAHNASFDLGIIAREDIVPARHICTYKVACAIDGEGEIGKYSLQYLRYYFDIELDVPAHDALGDVQVLEGVFEELLVMLIDLKGSEEAALEEMLSISSRPLLFTTLRFGKHNGKKIAQVAKEDPSYLEWLLTQKRQNAEEDWIYTIEHYLKQK